MPYLLLRFIERQNRFQIHFGHWIAWGMLPLVIISCMVVILRYGFDTGAIALQEAIMYNHAILFMLGMAYTYQQQKHVRVDVFYSQFSATQKAWVNLLGGLLLALPTLGFIAWASFDYVLNSWRVFETSSEAGGLAFVYLLKTVIWLMVLLLTLQINASIAQAWLQIWHPEVAAQLPQTAPDMSELEGV